MSFGKIECSNTPRFFRLVLNQETTTELRGDLLVSWHRFAVRGAGDSGGVLTLTGSGNHINYSQTTTLDSWQTRLDGPAMTGDFSFTWSPISRGDPGTVTARLEDVFNVNSPEGQRDIPREALISMKIDEGSASRFAPGRFDAAGYTNYTGACHNMVNLSSERARLTITVTPIGADGRDYPVTQRGSGSTIGPGSSLSGCGGGSARDNDVNRPIAPTYRLRIEYQYDDGPSGFLEGVAPVRISRDELR